MALFNIRDVFHKKIQSLDARWIWAFMALMLGFNINWENANCIVLLGLCVLLLG